MTIKVLEKTEGCLPMIFTNGDWIDLVAAEDIRLTGPKANRLHKYKDKTEKVRDVDFMYTRIPLGVAMEIPKGYEAILAPRSSAFGKWGIIQTNSFGVIDNSYKGDNDEWKLPIMATRSVTIPKGTRLAQFRIQLSQKASFWQKLKAMFASSIKIVKVASLDNPERGGFGSTDSNN